MGEFPDELARALREWADSIQPSNALPKIWARIRRHDMWTEDDSIQAHEQEQDLRPKRFIAHYVADKEHPHPVLTVDMVFEAITEEAALIFAEEWGMITLAGQILDNCHELSSGGH